MFINMYSLDVVYISTYNKYHYSSTKLMLENGKNVLCEIPFCQNAEQVKELVEVFEIFIIVSLPEQNNHI